MGMANFYIYVKNIIAFFNPYSHTLAHFTTHYILLSGRIWPFLMIITNYSQIMNQIWLNKPLLVHLRMPTYQLGQKVNKIKLNIVASDHY